MAPLASSCQARPSPDLPVRWSTARVAQALRKACPCYRSRFYHERCSDEFEALMDQAIAVRALTARKVDMIRWNIAGGPRQRRTAFCRLFGVQTPRSLTTRRRDSHDDGMAPLCRPPSFGPCYTFRPGHISQDDVLSGLRAPVQTMGRLLRVQPSIAAAIIAGFRGRVPSKTGKFINPLGTLPRRVLRRIFGPGTQASGGRSGGTSFPSVLPTPRVLFLSFFVFLSAVRRCE